MDPPTVKDASRSSDCGILQTLNSNGKKFSGLIKQRFSDFHVHEVDPFGKEVHLTFLDLPRGGDEMGLKLEDDVLVQILTPEIQERINAIQDSTERPSESESTLEINVTSIDKTFRTKIHRFVSQFDRLVSETIDRNEGKFIRVFKPAPAGSKEARKHNRRPFNRAKFTHCVLYKEGIDTSDAINYLSRKLKFDTKHITFAGTKDKQAKTVQRICFSNLDAKRLLSLNEYSSHSKLGNFSYEASPLHLGELSGNHFKILIRNVQGCSREEISDSVENLSRQGFINYYGLQRFGTFKVPTFLIGKALLQMDWLRVFDLILTMNDERDPGFMKKAKKLWLENRDAARASKEIPYYHKSIESSLLHGLSKFYATGDHWASFKSIPKNMRTLYMHSYQSYLWNFLASHRIEKFGIQPVVGDMVLVNSEPYESLEPNYDCEEDEPQRQKTIMPSNSTLVKILNECDLANYTIFDVVIPLEGSDVSIPDHSILKPYSEELVKEHGVGGGFTDFNPRCELPKGAYRKVVTLPKNVKHQVIPYSDEDNLDTFIPSDYDLIVAKQKKEETMIQDQPRCPDAVPKEKDKICLIIEFTLPPSSYATMALREILEHPEGRGFRKRSIEANIGSTEDSSDAVSNCKKPKMDDTVT